MSDFFDGHFGYAGRTRLNAPTNLLKDAALNLRLAFSARLRRVLAKAAASPPRRVLVVGVEVPARAGQLQIIAAALARSRHQVDVSLVAMKPQGKFANVDDAIRAAPRPLADYDWLIVTDDDVAFAPGFLDRYLALAEAAGLAISQPAHRFASHASYLVTRRRAGSLVRSSRFVEIGPLTVLRNDTFGALIPFPASRWCYGIDALWSDIAQRKGWTMGIVDAAPVAHLKPVAETYDATEALAEGRALLASFAVKDSGREQLLVSAPLLDA